MNIEPEKINVLDLLPQRPPFIMIDQLIQCDLMSSKAIFTVREDNLFCKNGVMEETGLIENIAQTCAASASFKQFSEYNDSSISTTKVKIGVIVMIHSMEMKRRPLAGEVLDTSVTIESTFFPTTMVWSEVHIGDETIATCRMKLLMTEKTPD